ncbi:MAG: hypothetical protein D6738_11485 [Acidobacteria bacterium]|nr:MAG: hypothetical protein D6738_11485 [Acidobacteriota bacterium]
MSRPASGRPGHPSRTRCAALLLAAWAAGVVPAAAADAAGPPPAAPDRPEVYRLEAADGVPAAFLVPLVIDRPGPLRVVVRWTGRGLAWVELQDEAGRELFHRTGTSPLEFALEVPQEVARRQPEWTLRFRTSVARGALHGLVEVQRPRETVPGLPSAAAAVSRPVRRPAAGARWTGAAACLWDASRGETDAARALRRLGEAVEAAAGEDLSWARGWAARIAALSGQERPDGSLPRSRIDRLWRDLRLARPARADLADGVRAVLAALEDLVRREQEARSGARRAALRGQRRALAGAVACLAPAEESPSE